MRDLIPVLLIILFNYTGAENQVFGGSDLTESGSEVEECLLNHGLRQSQIILRDRSTTRVIYRYLNYQWNVYYPVKTPMMYVLPENSKHIQEIVYCSRMHGVRAVPKGGGHSFAKYAYGDKDSVVMDFQNFRSIFVDEESGTVTIDPGVRIGPLNKKLTSMNYIFPTGRCYSVGIAASLGGGYSAFARQYGMFSDWLLEVDIVTPSAKLITANHEQNKDLFWAIRGAGAGAAFGIVTRYKFKLLPKPYKVVYGKSYYPLKMLPQILSRYMSLSKSSQSKPQAVGMEINANHIWVFAQEAILKPQNFSAAGVEAMLNYFPGATNTSLSIQNFQDILTANFNAERFEEFEGRLIHDGINYFNYHNHMDHWSVYKLKAFITDKILDEEDVLKLSSLIKEEILDNSFIEFLPFGGAISNFKPSDTAFVHRNPMSYKVALHYTHIHIHSNCSAAKTIIEPENCSLASPDPDIKSNSLRFLHKLYNQTLEIFGHSEAYQNDVDEELDDYLERFFGSNLPRLMKIKKQFDPDNYFHNPQSIPPL